MMTTIENCNKEQFEIETFFSKKFIGRGSWRIKCEVNFKNKTKVFITRTTDSQHIDLINGMRSDNKTSDEIQKEYNDTYFERLEESIIEWCEEVTN